MCGVKSLDHMTYDENEKVKSMLLPKKNYTEFLFSIHGLHRITRKRKALV